MRGSSSEPLRRLRSPAARAASQSTSTLPRLLPCHSHFHCRRLDKKSCHPTQLPPQSIDFPNPSLWLPLSLFQHGLARRSCWGRSQSSFAGCRQAARDRDVDVRISLGCGGRAFLDYSSTLAHPDQHAGARRGRIKDVGPGTLEEPYLKEVGRNIRPAAARRARPAGSPCSGPQQRRQNAVQRSR
jgi:hypothetical protein